ncbi:MAG: hypothetical protein D4R98_07430 [Comamonadaceae bacterium]|nr:MAG: hypothetical protein D4R98_07430 [Comamonadaceae bacterium]
MVNKFQGVISRAPFFGKAEILPRIVIPAKGDKFFATSTISPLIIAEVLVAPVAHVNKKSKIKQEIREGWSREIRQGDFSKVVPGAKSIIISARNSWNLYDNNINIIETAYILDGANYLNELVAEASTIEIPIVIIFDKNENEELSIRSQIIEKNTSSVNDVRFKVGTNAPRLPIDENWKDVKIKTDPFVIKTGMGYTAAINVIEKKSKIIHHILIGAKSIGNELEFIRLKHGTLVDIELKIRKQSADQKSQYEVEVLN